MFFSKEGWFKWCIKQHILPDEQIDHILVWENNDETILAATITFKNRDNLTQQYHIFHNYDAEETSYSTENGSKVAPYFSEAFQKSREIRRK